MRFSKHSIVLRLRRGTNQAEGHSDSFDWWLLESDNKMQDIWRVSQTVKKETSTQDSLLDLWCEFDLLQESTLESKGPISRIKVISLTASSVILISKSYCCLDYMKNVREGEKDNQYFFPIVGNRRPLKREWCFS